MTYLCVYISFFTVISFCNGLLSFVFEDRNHSPHKLFHVLSAHLSPYPMEIPGNNTGELVILVLRKIDGRYRVQVDIHKRTLFEFWIKIPCLSSIGSCEYDLCDLLTRSFIEDDKIHCPKQLEDLNLPCTCPFPARIYTLSPTTFVIPRLATLPSLSWLATGDYRVDVKVIEASTGEEVINYHVELSVTDPSECDGFLCGVFG